MTDHLLDARPVLTRREVEVAALVVAGLQSKQIASRLVVSESTVNTHIDNIYRKTGVHGRAAFTAQAFRLGLLPGIAKPPTYLHCGSCSCEAR